MKVKWNKVTLGIIGFLAFSFWSSGVMLIRVLGEYGIWNGGTSFWIFSALSVPLVWFSILGVKKMLGAIETDRNILILYIISLVVIAHAVFLSSYPRLYAFTESPPLEAAAWLMWFGGCSMLVALIAKNK
jgi:hypothetical protein